MKHQAFGFGTFKMGFTPTTASAVATDAPHSELPMSTSWMPLAVAYHFLECMQVYGNETQAGKAIADSGIDCKC